MINRFSYYNNSGIVDYKQNNKPAFGNKFEKLCDRFLDPRKRLSVNGEDAEAVLKHLGAHLKSAGSHKRYEFPTGDIVSFATHKMGDTLKPPYVEAVRAAINKYKTGANSARLA